MSLLILVRHGISEYNAKGLWAGWDDPILTPEGIEEAKKAGGTLKDIRLDEGYTSDLIRAKHTLELIFQTRGKTNIPITIARELRERNYGDFTAKNKWEVKKMLGDEEFLKLRRSWDYPVSNGESLKQVYERVIPYFQSHILTKLKSGKNILISSSGNALRALVKYIENIPDDQIASLEIATGEVYMYNMDQTGKMTSKEIRASHPNMI